MMHDARMARATRFSRRTTPAGRLTMLFLCAAILVAAVARARGGRSQEEAHAPAAAANRLSAPREAEGEAASRRDAEWGSRPWPDDPFARAARAPGDGPGRPAPPPRELRLAGVIASGARPVAILSGRSCAVGDTVEGALVESIAADEVVLRRGERAMVLRVAR